MKTKTLTLSFACSLLVLLAVILLNGCATPASSTAVSGPAGQLVITRSFKIAGFPLAVMVDGQRVATLGYNRAYIAPIAPGPHTINVMLIPANVQTQGQPIRIVVRAGETYRFTATRVGSIVRLR